MKEKINTTVQESVQKGVDATMNNLKGRTKDSWEELQKRRKWRKWKKRRN